MTVTAFLCSMLLRFFPPPPLLVHAHIAHRCQASELVPRPLQLLTPALGQLATLVFKREFTSGWSPTQASQGLLMSQISTLQPTSWSESPWPSRSPLPNSRHSFNRCPKLRGPVGSAVNKATANLHPRGPSTAFLPPARLRHHPLPNAWLPSSP